MAQHVRAALCAAAAVPSAGYWCHSDLHLGGLTSSQHKGLAIDDTTFRHCPGKVPEVWPNTLDVVDSLRLFKAWDPSWPARDREPAWQRLEYYVRVNSARVLFGTQVTCQPEADDQDWHWTKELMQRLGPERVMGVAVGNEMELLFSKQGLTSAVTEECILEMWGGGYFWRTFVHRVTELDSMGFSGVTVTSVFGGLALNGWPFMESPREALVTSFLGNASRTYGRRFAFTFNFYPYFDQSFTLDPNTTECTQALAAATCFESNCSLPMSAARARRKIQQLTGRSDDTYWIGETGWSMPTATSLDTDMALCTDWSMPEAFKTFYQHFLEWDVAFLASTAERSPEMDAGLLPPDHIFFFTLRDSVNYGVQEYFGLVSSCRDQRCKLHSDGYLAPGEVPSMSLGWIKWTFASLAGSMLLAFGVVAVHARLTAEEETPLKWRFEAQKGLADHGRQQSPRTLSAASSSGMQAPRSRSTTMLDAI